MIKKKVENLFKIFLVAGTAVTVLSTPVKIFAKEIPQQTESIDIPSDISDSNLSSELEDVFVLEKEEMELKVDRGDDAVSGEDAKTITPDEIITKEKDTEGKYVVTIKDEKTPLGTDKDDPNNIFYLFFLLLTPITALVASFPKLYVMLKNRNQPK